MKYEIKNISCNSKNTPNVNRNELKALNLQIPNLIKDTTDFLNNLK